MTGTIKQRLQHLLFLTILVMLSDPVYALGLGEATVHSYLQEPLDVRIRLVSRSEAELASVTAQMASAREFEVIGLSRATLSVPLTFEVIRDPADPHIRMRSSLPILDPVVQVVIEVTWASGRMLRQYTLFLDPPTFSSPAPLPAPARPEPRVIAAPPPVASPPVNTVETVEEPAPEPPTEQVAAPVEEERTAPERDGPVPVEPTTEEPVDIPADAVESLAEASTEVDPRAAERRAANFGTGPDFQPDSPPAETAEPAEPSMILSEDSTAEPPSDRAGEQPVADAGNALPAQEETETAPGAVEVTTPAIDDELTPEMLAQADEAPIAEAMQAVDEPEPPTQEAPDTATPDEPVDVTREVSENTGEDATNVAIAAAEDPPYEEDALLDTTEEIATAAEILADTADDSTDEDVSEAAAASETPDVVAEDSPVEPPEPEAAVAEAVAPPAVDRGNQPPPEAYRAVIPAIDSGETVTVQRGDTLWEIANEWRGDRDYSVNQVMLAIQQQNPSAFNRGNINSLRSGAILRMPADATIERLSGRQAMLEVMRQEDAYRNRWNELADPPAIPALAEAVEAPAETEPDIDADASVSDLADVALDVEEDGSTAELADASTTDTALDSPRLELVPPSAQDAGSGSGLGEGANEGSGVSEGESVVEELARAREDLVNAEQENEYLGERIAELEAELARREAEAEADTGLGVADTGLAEMEDRLEAARTDPNAPDEDLPIVPPSEDPWFKRLGLWLIGLLVLAVGGVIWWLRSRPTLDDQVEAEMTALAGAAPGAPGEPESSGRTTGDESDAAGSGDTDDLQATITDLRSFQPNAPLPQGEEAVELDSDDPETQLDLARAYLSMGDIDAARGMLERVLAEGTEEQVAEARGMLDEL